MKKLSASETRKVEGGKTYYCSLCYETLPNWGQWIAHKYFDSVHISRTKWMKKLVGG